MMGNYRTWQFRVNPTPENDDSNIGSFFFHHRHLFNNEWHDMPTVTTVSRSVHVKILNDEKVMSFWAFIQMKRMYKDLIEDLAIEGKECPTAPYEVLGLTRSVTTSIACSSCGARPVEVDYDCDGAYLTASCDSEQCKAGGEFSRDFQEEQFRRRMEARGITL